MQFSKNAMPFQFNIYLPMGFMLRSFTGKVRVRLDRPTYKGHQREEEVVQRKDGPEQVTELTFWQVLTSSQI